MIGKIRKKINFLFKNKIRIVGLIRMRNEELILEDTLNSFSDIVDGIIVYDDASTDSSVEIAKKHPNVIEIIENEKWKKNRAEEETRHRQTLLDCAKKYKPEWIFYSDCDERFEGDIRDFLVSKNSNEVDGIRISLFDAYITENDKKQYESGKLYDFRKYFGPEKRDILMIWRNLPEVKFEGLDKREPVVKGTIVTRFYCQHYGKSLSVEHWEQTCDYYANSFPKYADKWKKRKGKAIHDSSDFNRKLESWEDVKRKAVKIN